MNLLLSKEIHTQVRGDVLVNFILGGVAIISGISIVALHGASGKDTKVLVQVGKESADI